MAEATSLRSSSPRRLRSLALHGAALIGLMAAGIGVATVHGALWPFDLRFSALITAGGIAVLAIAWWPAALAIGVVAALLPRLSLRLLLWPLVVLSMIALHAVLGPRQGFLPLSNLGPLGALRLYAIPVATAILIGSLLRDTLLPRRASHAPQATSPRATSERIVQ